MAGVVELRLEVTLRASARCARDTDAGTGREMAVRLLAAASSRSSWPLQVSGWYFLCSVEHVQCVQRFFQWGLWLPWGGIVPCLYILN